MLQHLHVELIDKNNNLQGTLTGELKTLQYGEKLRKKVTKEPKDMRYNSLL